MNFIIKLNLLLAIFSFSSAGAASQQKEEVAKKQESQPNPANNFRDMCSNICTSTYYRLKTILQNGSRKLTDEQQKKLWESHDSCLSVCFIENSATRNNDQ